MKETGPMLLGILWRQACGTLVFPAILCLLVAAGGDGQSVVGLGFMLALGVMIGLPASGIWVAVYLMGGGPDGRSDQG